MNTHALCVSLLALPALVACQSGLSKGPLDGRVYEVTLAGPQEAQPDRLVFDGGRFESTACRSYGFVTTPYSTKENGSAKTFEASAKSGKAGSTAWNGAIQGETIEGTMIWTDDKGQKNQFRFSGRKSSGLLDGETFEGMVCPGESKTGDSDRLVFSNGAFDSNACRAYGFTMSPYSATAAADGTHFSADAINADGEKNHWEGVVKGEDVSGTMEHSNASGKVTDKYRFVAKLVK
ncbi:MAG TPA: hypothetical protein VK843_16725 [Planctomycetota bacterium]|nr:hypothetical protein [Planctomycetota bacterium]